MMYAIHRPDGGVGIMDSEIDPREVLKRHLSRAEINERLASITNLDQLAREARALSMYVASDDAVTIVPITDADIPQDRTFRDGWKLDGKKIGHDMAKCRDIHREHMRQARAPKLAALDVEFIRAVERGDAAAQTRIAADKQALRDVTADPAIESAKTPEALKAIWPL